MNINENEKENEQKEEEPTDIIKISLNIEEDKYTIKIYSSKDNSTIIFKIEQENIQTFYFYEKFDLRDFKQKHKEFLTNESIQDIFNTLKKIIEKNTTKLEKNQLKMNISFLNKSETIATFSLRKKLVSQNRLNPLLVEQIQENKSKLNTIKKQIVKFDKSIQNQNDTMNNLNSKMDLINNNIKNIISDINNINSIIKNFIQNEKIKNSINNNEEKTKNNNKRANKNNNKDIIKKENINTYINNKDNIFNVKKEENAYDVKKENINFSCFKNTISKIERNNKILFLLDIIIYFLIFYLILYSNRLNNILQEEKTKNQKLLKRMSIFEIMDKISDEQFDYFEANMRKLKDQNFNPNTKSNKSNRIIDKFKVKLKNSNNNIKTPFIKINNDNKETAQFEPNANNANKKNEEIEKNINYQQPKSIKDKINNNQKDLLQNENITKKSEDKHEIKGEKKDMVKNNNKKKDDKYILQTEEEINYFKNKIKEKATYKIKDVNLVLKYKSDDSSYNNFLKSCKSISENLILIKNKEGKKIGIFSKNIIGIFNSIINNNLSYNNSNFIGYIFSQENVDEFYFKEFFGVYEAFVSVFKDIFTFLKKENQLSQLKNLDNSKLEDYHNYFGDIEKIEIYQIKYIIK
jgi:hypothetical protein